MDFPITTRRAAHTLGMRRYYTGRPCIHGHDSQRWVVTGGCIICARNSARSFKAIKDGRLILVDVKVKVHPDDAGQITDLAAALNGGRDAARAAQPFDGERLRRMHNPLAYGADVRPGDPDYSAPRGKPSD